MKVSIYKEERKESKMKIITFAIPCYNSQDYMEKCINSLLPGGDDVEIIIVDDGSVDGSRVILADFARMNEDIKVIYHEKNQGKGAAIKTALDYITGDYVIIQDADLEYDPQEYTKLLEPMLYHGADVVYGSRFLGGPHRVLLFWHYIGNKLLTFFTNMLYNINLNDMETGFKAFRIDVLRRITIKSLGFAIEPELTAKVAKMGCVIHEVPIAYYGRTYADGKKIVWRDGVWSFLALLRFRFFD